ncbi:MAG TPA: uracil-DNA glycosylase family protein [Candidatus Limnocylindrales bacterium]|nr:uracil-DNA glycosylase family protein [Candidatus Limnocylindrales bacterium]
MAALTFDPGPSGPSAARFLDLLDSPPPLPAYPWAKFRREWGPIFYRGRLDGTARILVIGQDPGQHECIGRRILVGEAGQRVQGFLAKLGITRSYVMVNAFLFCCFTKQAAIDMRDDPSLAPDRDAWIAAVLETGPVEVVVAFGGAARDAYQGYLARRTSGLGRPDPAFVHVVHPTAPIAEKSMLTNWNTGLAAAFPALTARDVPVSLVPYGTAFTPADFAPIPPFDMPAGAPPWMGGVDNWAWREAAAATPTSPAIPKRARLVVAVPEIARGW